MLVYLNNTATDPTVISPVGQTLQTITFTSPGNQSGPASIALSVSSTSGLTLVLTSNSPAVCMVSGSYGHPVCRWHLFHNCESAGESDLCRGNAVHKTFAISSSGGAAAITFAPSANPSLFGQPLTLTATVTPVAATGRVTFYSGVTILGIEQSSNGTASITTSLLSSGPNSLRAYYGGDR